MNEAEYIAAETERLLRGAVRLCACGCGHQTKCYRGRWSRFLPGHNAVNTRNRNFGLSKVFRAEYAAFRDAKFRCTNLKAKEYSAYGARGIRFLFRDFFDFWLNVGPRPSPEYSLERDNNNGNYEPSNCYWALRSVQDANKRMNNQYTKGRPMQDELEPLY